MIDVAKKQILVYDQPTPAGYQNTSPVETGRLTATGVPQLKLLLTEIFP
jgi:hypothetical protein